MALIYRNQDAVTAGNAANPATPSADPGGHVEQHVSVRVLAATLATLLILTLLTVAATWYDFGALNLWIAMIIATVKAILVALFFMHLRYDRPFNAVILAMALLFVLIFCSLTLMDVAQYQPNVQEWRAEDPSRYAPDLPIQQP